MKNPWIAILLQSYLLTKGCWTVSLPSSSFDFSMLLLLLICPAIPLLVLHVFWKLSSTSLLEFRRKGRCGILPKLNLFVHIVGLCLMMILYSLVVALMWSELENFQLKNIKLYIFSFKCLMLYFHILYCIFTHYYFLYCIFTYFNNLVMSHWVIMPCGLFLKLVFYSDGDISLLFIYYKYF